MFGGTGPGGYAPFDIDAIAPGFLRRDGDERELEGALLLVRRRRPADAVPEEVAEQFRNAGVKSTFKNFAGCHEWRVWRASLADVATMLFK